jgi:hypothetical protein
MIVSLSPLAVYRFAGAALQFIAFGGLSPSAVYRLQQFIFYP